MSERIFLDTKLEPNKPLAPLGLALVIGLAALVSFWAGIIFALRGAWPVAPFFGADMLLLIWAMRASVRSSRRREHLLLTNERLLIESQGARGEVRREEINPYWLRVEHEDPELLGSELALVSRGRRWIVGSFLGAEERANLAAALRRALRDARDFTPAV